MTSLLTLSEAGQLLRCRDPRTARKRLAALGVPVVPVGRSVLVPAADLDRALRVAATVNCVTACHSSSPAGVVLPPGARLWDTPSETKVAPRRASARGRGTGGVSSDASRNIPALPDDQPAARRGPSSSLPCRREEER